MEWKVLMYYLDGKSYQEIAKDLHRHIKSIDNALQRVKRKLEKYMARKIHRVLLTGVVILLLLLFYNCSFSKVL